MPEAMNMVENTEMEGKLKKGLHDFWEWLKSIFKKNPNVFSAEQRKVIESAINQVEQAQEEFQDYTTETLKDVVSILKDVSDKLSDISMDKGDVDRQLDSIVSLLKEAQHELDAKSGKGFEADNAETMIRKSFENVSDIQKLSSDELAQKMKTFGTKDGRIFVNIDSYYAEIQISSQPISRPVKNPTTGMIETSDVYHLNIGRASVKDTAFLREITEIKGLDGRSIEEKIKGTAGVKKANESMQKLDTKKREQEMMKQFIEKYQQGVVDGKFAYQYNTDRNEFMMYDAETKTQVTFRLTEKDGRHAILAEEGKTEIPFQRISGKVVKQWIQASTEEPFSIHKSTKISEKADEMLSGKTAEEFLSVYNIHQKHISELEKEAREQASRRFAESYGYQAKSETSINRNAYHLKRFLDEAIKEDGNDCYLIHEYGSNVIMLQHDDVSCLIHLDEEYGIVDDVRYCAGKGENEVEVETLPDGTECRHLLDDDGTTFSQRQQAVVDRMKGIYLTAFESYCQNGGKFHEESILKPEADDIPYAERYATFLQRTCRLAEKRKNGLEFEIDDSPETSSFKIFADEPKECYLEVKLKEETGSVESLTFHGEKDDIVIKTDEPYDLAKIFAESDAKFSLQEEELCRQMEMLVAYAETCYQSEHGLYEKSKEIATEFQERYSEELQKNPENPPEIAMITYEMTKDIMIDRVNALTLIEEMREDNAEEVFYEQN